MMKKLLFKNIVVEVYQDPMEFANMDEKPFGDIPDEYQFAGIVNMDNGEVGEFKSTGFTTLDDKTIRIYCAPDCEFDDLLSTVSHEMGHLIEGGFKKNPPNSNRYTSRHEQKAEHYEHFVMDCYNLTKQILKENESIKFD